MSGGIISVVRPGLPPPDSPPTTPQYVSATPLDSTSIKVTWSAAQAVVSSGIAGYRIFRNNAFAKNTANVLTWTDTQCAPSTTYGYKVKAIDAYGNLGTFSSTVNATTPAGTPPLSRHNHVGHWVDVPRFEQVDFGGVPRAGVAGTTYATADRLDIAGVQGVFMRYRWRELESTQGVYTFSRVVTELAQCQAIGTARGTPFRFVLFLEVKAFDGVNPAPNYLQAYTSTNGQNIDMWRWNSTVRSRFDALIAALAAQFDSHPCWEGIAVSETSTAAAQTQSDAVTGYSPEAFRDALIAESNAIASSCTYGRHFFYQNFLSGHNGYLDNVVEAGIDNGAMVMCAPDILPGKVSLENNVYPRYATYNGSLPLQCSAQNDSHMWNSTIKDTVSPYDTMQSIFDYGRNTLKLSWLTWTWRRSGAGHHFADDAAVITATQSWTP